MSAAQTDMDWVWGFFISFVAIIALHQPEFSIQAVLIGSRPFSSTEMALLKLVTGLLTSLVIFAVSGALIRRLSKGLIWAVLITQLLSLEIEWGFSLGAADFNELMVRFAEEAGVIVSGLAIFAYMAMRPKPNEPAS